MQDIREITGYLLIVSVYADIVPLTSLNIVRGRTLFDHAGRNYSIFVSNNFSPAASDTGTGLRELQMPSLHGPPVLSPVISLISQLLQRFDAVGWAAGRASGL